MFWKILFSFLSFLFILLVIFLLFFYWFIPFGTVEFALKPELRNNYNFSLEGFENMQFYTNMRYPDSKISYKIEDCTLQKKDDMKRAFEIMESQTILNFNLVNNNERIFVTCENKIKIEEDFFIAGEGGPTNITKTENFNVISHGSILLLRDSKCQNPNIALHELLHALGFDHSSNPNNIMYNLSKCNQVISGDIINTINELYSIQSYPDLSFENVSAALHGRYLDINISVRNNGLSDSEKTNLIIYADEKSIKEIELDPMEIGYGVTMTLGNIWIPKINVQELKILINSTFEELDKNNNIIRLEIKNK